MNAKVFTQEGVEKGTMTLPDAVFMQSVNEQLLHLVIKSYLANQRQGTSKTKTRAEVSGGGKKPYRQKGTGRARAGSNTSPIWVRGGKAFGPVPRSYYSVIPRKLRVSALCSAYSQRAKEEKIFVIDQLVMDAPKTKRIAALIEKLTLNGKKNLFVIGKDDHNIYLSGQNIKNVTIRLVTDVNAYDIINSENVVFCNEDLIAKVTEVAAS